MGRIGRAGDVLAASSYDEFGIELGGQADDDFAFTGYQRDSIIVGDEKW